MSDGWAEERTRNAAARAELEARAMAKETAQAQALIDAFVAEAGRRGIQPHVLLAPGPDLRGRRYTTGRIGWYLTRDERTAVDIDGKFFVLRARGTLRERLTGAVVEPMDPPLIVGRGGRDGEAIDLDRLLRRRLDEAG